MLSNVHKLFTGPLQPTRVTMETADGIGIHSKLVGAQHLVLTDDSNKNHIYTIPGCVYNPDSPLNILGVPTLGKFFKDSASLSNELGEDGTTVKSRATKSHLIWDQGKQERHFLHGPSNLPELCLYVGDGYFNALCTLVYGLLSGKVCYALSSAYSIQPTPTVKRAPQSNLIPYEEGDLDEHGSY